MSRPLASSRTMCLLLTLMQFVCVCQMSPWCSTLCPCWHNDFLLLLLRLELSGPLSWLTLLLIGSFMADRCCLLATSQAWPNSGWFVTAMYFLQSLSIMCLHGCCLQVKTQWHTVLWFLKMLVRNNNTHTHTHTHTHGMHAEELGVSPSGRGRGRERELLSHHTLMT